MYIYYILTRHFLYHKPVTWVIFTVDAQINEASWDGNCMTMILHREYFATVCFSRRSVEYVQCWNCLTVKCVFCSRLLTTGRDCCRFGESLVRPSPIRVPCGRLRFVPFSSTSPAAEEVGVCLDHVVRCFCALLPSWTSVCRPRSLGRLVVAVAVCLISAVSFHLRLSVNVCRRRFDWNLKSQNLW